MIIPRIRSSIISPILKKQISSKATFGAGCYWGCEKFFNTNFNELYPNVISEGKNGFMHPLPNPKIINPTYKQVCTGTTDYVEVYDFIYDGDENTYMNLVKHFFKFHDPTTLNSQGNDRGTQYKSSIFVHDDIQKEIAKNVINELQILINEEVINMYSNKIITTQIYDSQTFYVAQKDHQNYLSDNPSGYCNHRYRFNNWPSKYNEL